MLGGLDLARRLQQKAQEAGLNLSELVREQLEKVYGAGDDKPWMKLAGSVKGLPRDLSTRKGFSRK